MRYFLFSPDDKIEYVGGGTLSCRAGDPLRSLTVPDSALLLCGRSGSCSIRVGSTVYELSEGNYLLCPAGEQLYSAVCALDFSFDWCCFRLPKGSRRFLGDAPSEAYSLPLCGVSTSHTQITPLLDRLNRAARQSTPHSHSLCNMALMLLLTELAESTSHGGSKGMTAVTDWIRTHIAAIGSARDVAEHFGYNCEYLTTALRQFTGKTLTEHIRDARIGEAKGLLLFSSLSVKEIAHRCGFSDDKYFLKVFRAATDMTPGQYRNAFCSYAL